MERMMSVGGMLAMGVSFRVNVGAVVAVIISDNSNVQPLGFTRNLKMLMSRAMGMRIMRSS